VEALLNAQEADSPSRARKTRTVLNLLVGYALRHDATNRDPVQGTHRPSPRVSTSSSTPPSTEPGRPHGAHLPPREPGRLFVPERLAIYLDPIARAQMRRDIGNGDGRSVADDLFKLAGIAPEGWAA